MAEGLGFGRKRLIDIIIKENWDIDPIIKKYSYNELLYVIQELLTNEGKSYFDKPKGHYGHFVFKEFTKLLLYRNIANYDSMVLLTSDKGCVTDDSLLEMPRDLKKYPKGIPLKDLVGKGPQWVYSFNIQTKKLELKKCDGVEFVKKDDVWEIELTNGMKLKATSEHPFLQIDGEYKQLKDLIYFNKLKLEGMTQCGTYGKYYIKELNEWIWKKADRLRIITRPFKWNSNNMIKVDYSKIDRKNGDIGYKYGEGNKEHFYKHGMPKFWFKKNNKYCYHKGYSTKKRDRVKIKTEEFNKQCKEKRILFCNTNKEILSKIAKNRVPNNINSNYIRVGGIIKSIKYIGKRKVYDVVNVQDNHNFIVNGFVVSNTGKSSAAIMLARYWCLLLGIRFDPKKHIAYTNADVINKIEALPKFHPIICDESVRFASAEDWAKKEGKVLKKKLAQVRTKHLLYILCFPLKVQKLEKNYLESFTNYWIDLFGRGIGAIYIKDKNPSMDSWRVKDFDKVGSYTEFTDTEKIAQMLKNHPNFWQIIKFPKPPAWLYTKYLKTREANVYDDENVLANTTSEDVHKALLILTLRDMMTHDPLLNINRVILHIRNEFDVTITKSMVQSIIEDCKQLVIKLREKAIEV